MTNRSLSLSQAIVGLDVKNFGLEYYDADGDGAMVVRLVVVIIVGYITQRSLRVRWRAL